MIKTTAMLRDELGDYVNPDAKIKRMVQEKMLFPVARGIYETNRDVSGYCFAGVIYGPSYLSFEFAMSLYGLIPEAVYMFTSATYEKKKRKQFENIFGIYTYRDVPADVYTYGVELIEENGYYYWIASPEKAVCDMLYKAAPLKNGSELRVFLFDDLRVDSYELSSLNMDKMLELCGMYRTKNHRLMESFLRKEKKYGHNAETDASDI